MMMTIGLPLVKNIDDDDVESYYDDNDDGDYCSNDNYFNDNENSNSSKEKVLALTSLYCARRAHSEP